MIRIFNTGLAFICIAVIAAPTRAESLDVILARMDRAAKDFKSLSAKIKQVEFTAVLNESTEATGEVRLKRQKGGVVGIEDFKEPDPRVIHLSGHTAERYFPKAKTVEIYDAGKYASSMDRFVLLGFGVSGADLKKDYTITAAGTETLGSTPATRLELTPHASDLQKMITKIELWIPEGQSNPIQEKVLQPSKNYTLVAYSDLKVNPDLPDSAFELKLPPDVKKIYPQK